MLFKKMPSSVLSISFLVVTLFQIGSLLENRTCRVGPSDSGNYPASSNISRNNGQWRQAERDCKNHGFLGLAEIKDRSEFDQVAELLEANADIAASYWVGAKYVPSTKKFKWTATKQFVGEWLQEVWEDGYPGSSLNAQTALQLKYTRNGGWRFRTGVISHNARYLCEGEEPECI